MATYHASLPDDIPMELSTASFSRAPVAAVIVAAATLLLSSAASEFTTTSPRVALWAIPATTTTVALTTPLVTHEASFPRLASNQLRLSRSAQDLPVPHHGPLTPQNEDFAMPAMSHLGLSIVTAAVAIFTGLALRQWHQGMQTTSSPLAMVSVSGERFDPLGLQHSTAEAECERRLAAVHGRVTLGGLLATGAMVTFLCASAGPALAQGLDFGFNYDFDVEFEGLKIDHRILVDVIVTGQAIGFIGAVIGGYSARQRKREVEDLASKLKQVNRQLRQQARRQKEGLYTPLDIRSSLLQSTVEVEADPSNVIEILKTGKKLLRDGDAQKSLELFNQALAAIDTSPDVKDPLMAKRKAWRGIGGAHVQLGKLQPALQAMQTVLDLTRQIGDNTGLCDAYGVIADIYTDMNKLDKAAEYYDLYIANLEQDQSSDTV